jgi:translation initiation factor 2 gamma subunit (eIF-2gamma)
MTVRFKNELVRNITIKLGYANAKVRPILPNASLADQGLLRRFTSVKTRPAHDQAATDPTVPIKKITHPVNVLAVVTA